MCYCDYADLIVVDVVINLVELFIVGVVISCN